MKLIRLISAFLILVFFSLFVSSNLLQTDQTSGTFGKEYLVGGILAFLVAVIARGDLVSLLTVRKTAFPLVAFLAYTISKYYLEADEEQIQQVVYGSTQGLLFSLSLGLVCSYALFTIYNLYKQSTLSLSIIILTIAYLAFVAISIYTYIQKGSVYISSDAFRVVDDIAYQRPGDLLILQLLVTASTALILLTKNLKLKIFVFLILSALTVVIAILTGLLSQLFWSNKGALAGGGIAFVYLVCSFASLFARSDQRIHVSNILFGRLGLYLIIGVVLGVTIIGLSATNALNYFEIDYSQLRIFENEGEIRSVESRKEVFKQNFVKHFEYSPVFGNTQVEKIFGDHGYYVHSTLSILTHLGAVGFLIFLFLLTGIYLDITRGNDAPRDDVLPNNAIYGLLRLGLFSFVLCMGLYSAFFTWMPLWFSIGFFGTWFSFKSDGNKHTLKKRRRKSRSSRRVSNPKLTTH